ncbi:MAG: DUF4255 domain-containing protein [Gemmataceae bacterium]|nr:DUF4255 domain-containing protein [Gemmataceae bacterium]
MSTFLGVGAVTAVLRQLLDDGIARHDLVAVLGAAPAVSCLPPDRVPVGAGQPDRLNLFLFQAAENPAWRNVGFPSRDDRGGRVSSPPLALDLHYLVTAYGSADFRAEVLLGLALAAFHETPVLTRQAIRDALDALPAGDPADAFPAARVADQFEQLRIVPRVMGTEEVSKVWSALQSQYRPTVAYQVSVLLIEPDRPARSPLPVLTRGRPLPGGGDEGVFVTAGLRPPVPTLEAVRPPNAAPAVRMGEVPTLRGHHLAGTVPTVARFRPVRETGMLELPAAAGAGDEEFTVQMPPDPPAGAPPAGSPLNPANWRAGVYEVSAVTTTAGRAGESNRLPVVLAPRVDAVAVVAGPPRLEVTCRPRVRPGQDVVLIVGNRELLPEPFAAATNTLTFRLPGAADPLPSGQQWVRLRVDGAESLLIDYAASPPRFDPTQSVVLP